MKKVCLALALASGFTVHAQFASTVVSYNSGTGFAAGFTNPNAALGAPASGPSVTPFAPPFSKSQIVSIGAGGELTLQMASPIENNPANPYGIDFNLFANSFFVSSGGKVSGLFDHATSTLIQVSQDDSTWYTLNPSLAPEPGALFPTAGDGNPNVAVNPALTLANFNGLDQAGVESLYDGSAGGTGYDLSWAEDSSGNSVNLASADYVRIEVQSGVLDLDAVASVPDSPSTLWMLAAACAGLFGVRILGRARTPVRAAAGSGVPALPILFALVGLFAASQSRAACITEDFSSNPLQHGWQVFGDSNLFQWDSTNHVLDVTWDSSQPNSYFYLPLGTMLTKNDDFSLSFDLTLSQAGTGDTDGPLGLALGFLNLTNAIDPGFERGAGVSPNIAEFDYYPYGFFPGFDSPATAAPSFVDSTSSAFAPDDLTPYEIVLPTNVLMHVAMTYTATNQTASLTISTNGIPLAEFPGLVINDSGNGGFTDENDYQVNIFSITSYSEAGQTPPYVASIFAQGTVGNLAVTLPPPAQNLTGSFTDGNWQVQFSARPNWLFTLQRTADFQTWTDVSPTISGIMGNLSLQDTNAPAAKGFYRVRAARP